MFSSIARSIKSIAKGPRAVLAENIARALSDHFVLDPADIESSLLKDARVVLKNTQLRARRYRSDSVPNTVVSVNGVVEEVEFSWRWSFSGGSSALTNSATGSSFGSGVVKDVVLTIRGVKAQIALDGWDTLDEGEQALVQNFESTSKNSGAEKDESSPGASLKEKEGFVQKYVKQIVDNLTLKLDDFDFTLKAGNGPSVVIAGKDLELETLSSAMGAKGNDGSSTTLSQRISIGSFFVNVKDGKSAKPFPLVEPFGYVASVIRHSGERFKGGILSGLQVIGLPEAQNEIVSDAEDITDEGILFHIGLPQIQALSALGVMLVPSNSCSTEPTHSGELEGHRAKDGGESSMFNLSLPALTVVLPLSGVEQVPTKITFPRATVVYRADGQVFQIDGREGIKDNGKSLVKLGTGGKWSVDFVKKIFDLDKECAGCKINLSDQALTRVASSVTSLFSTNEIADLKNAWEGTKGQVADKTQKVTSETWSISIGNISIHISGWDNHWLEANVARSHMELSAARDKPTEARIGECTIKTSLDHAAAITVPSFTFLSETLRISDAIDARVTSAECALQIKDFLLSFFQAFEKSNNLFDTFPFPVEIPGMKISASNPPSTIQIGATSAIGSNIQCEQVNASVLTTISFSTKGLLGNMISRSLSIDCVESFELPGTVALSNKLLNTNLKFEKEVLFVKIPTIIHAKMLPKRTSKTIPAAQQNAINLPFLVSVSVSKVNLKTLREGDKRCIEMEDIVFNVSPAILPAQDLLSGETQEGAKISLNIENIEHDMFQARMLRTSLILEDESLETLHQLEFYLHSVRIEAGYSTNEWSSLFKGAGSNDEAEQKVLKMPFAKIARTSMSISYQGSVVDGNTTVAIPEFQGYSLSTSDDLSKHYAIAVVQRIPGLLTNVNILGTNVIDGTFASVGKLALGARHVTTAGVGSVIGTVASDGVKAAIASGKSARNVTKDDSYQFGDITRGIFSGIRHATKKGAQSRGSDGSDYVPGDFTVGTASALGNYGENNSRKLASAGASGAAATVGFALAGPVGLLAGAYMGGRVVGGNGEQQQTPQQQQRQEQNQCQPNQPPERAFNHQRYSQEQHFAARTQQQEQQGIPMVNAQFILDEPVYAEPISNGRSNDRLGGNHRLGNSSQNCVQSLSNQMSQSRQYQLSPAPQSQHNQELQQRQYQQHQSQIHAHAQQHQKTPYKFGDFTRGIVAKGRQADGRSGESGYKFGKSKPENR